jgi:two-component sensor histidine kinase
LNPITKSLKSLGRKQIWGWPLFWFAMPLYFLLSFAFDVFLNDSWRIEWAVIAVTTYLAAAMVALLLKSVFVDRIFSKRGTWIANVVIFALVGAFKNCLVGLLSLDFGLVTQVDWQFRIYGGASLAFGVLIAFVYLLGARVEHNGIMAELASTRAKLVALRSQAQNVLAAERNSLLKQTQDTILPRLDEIQRSLIGNSERVSVVDELRDLVKQQVRPLSESLSKVAANLGSISVPPLEVQRTHRFLQDRQPLKLLIRPAAMSLFVLAGNWVLTYIVLGADATPWSLVWSLAVLALIAVAKALIPARLRVRPGVAIFVLVMIGFNASHAIYWPLKEFSHNFPQDLLLLLVVGNVMGCVIGFAYSKSVDLDRIEAVVQVTRENNSLAREAALFEQQMWIARRNWSFVVHGTVQAALTAAITRLSSAEPLEQYQIDLVRQDLTRAADALSKTPETEVDLPVALGNLQTTWKGICEIRFEISERANRSLQRDANARMCVNEICKEAVSNAVRHGEAKAMTIAIDRSADELLIIDASNTGRPVAANNRQGVGSAMLDDLTVEWSLTNNRARGRVVLQAKLPLAGISVGTL